MNRTTLASALAAALALAVAGCRSGPATTSTALAPWPGEIRSWGTLHEALGMGQVEARVAVDDIAREGLWAVGAVEGLEGEITIADGETWVTSGDANSTETLQSGAGTTGVKATVLFAAEVASWIEVTVVGNVGPDQFDDFLAAQARAAGLDPAAPFPFVVEGDLAPLFLHVVAGECPIRARASGKSLESPPFELRARTVSGQLVGIYAPDSAGIVCHMGSSSHTHALLAELGLTGHVERVGLSAGSVLRLPRL